MTALGAPDVKAFNVYSMGDHGSCVLPAHFYTLAWFDSLAVKRSPSVDLGEFDTSPEVQIYPNPTAGLLTIETAETDLLHIEIFTLSGQSVFNRTIEGPSMQVDLSSFQKGIYFLTIRSEDYMLTRKLIKL
jgi:hypothetical protein